MRNIFQPDTDAGAFLSRAIENGYSMENKLIEPDVCRRISRELTREDFMRDLVEMEPTEQFRTRHMPYAHLLHSALNGIICEIENDDKNHLPLFSVRVFEPGRYGTTVHRNHETIGPWAIGITLNGNAPFNVYHQNQLPRNTVHPLLGDETDPVPRETIETEQGSGWTLYTEDELVPHSSGIVSSDRQRELLLLYDYEYYDFQF